MPRAPPALGADLGAHEVEERVLPHLEVVREALLEVGVRLLGVLALVGDAREQQVPRW